MADIKKIKVGADELNLEDYQKKLTVGSNIQITSNGTISATDTTYSNFTGATSSTAGTNGLVPAPASGETDKYLKSDGTWATVQGGGSYTAGAHIDITNNVIKAKDYVHSESPVSTSSTPSISGSEISNGSITANKLATGAVLTLQTTTTDPGEGSALAENTLLAVYNQPHEYKSGELLAASQNTTELNWNGTTCTFWGAGTWTQYGRMKKTTDPAVLQITNPTSKPWIVEFSMSCSTVNVPSSCYVESGLCEMSLPTTITKRISQSIISCNGGNTNIWTSYSNKKLVTIPAGGTKNIGSFVRTSSANNATWKGGDELSGTSSNTNFGGASCILEAKLIDDGNS